jgi:type I restriction-modification system DNA methylase subunit
LSRITERTLYSFIGKVFEKFGWRYFSETGLDERFPDLVLEGDGAKVISEVKIDSEIQLTKAILEADQKARSLGTRNAVALLFPSYVRDIPLSELERNYPRLRISALILTDWLADRKELTLEDLAEAFTTSFRDWLKTKKTRVSYDLVVDVARDSIREIAGYLRQSLSQKPILDSAMAVVGRFDIYKNLLEDFSGVSEEEARLYIADITAYILINQLLFYHIISEKLGYDKLPDVDPLNPPKDFMDVLEHTLKKGREAYPHILGFDLFPVLRGDLRIVYSIARVVSTLKALRPQHISEDLFGRLYHETIPPETRKNLGAFYTKPEAARLLASLAIDRWDVKVLDPACGSGTLLVEAYQRKAALAPPMSKEELHKRLIDDIWGIDVMHFAYHMTSMNLTAQNIEVPLKPHVLSQDGIKTMIESAQKMCKSSDPLQSEEQPLAKWLEFVQEEKEVPNDFDVVIMNPPFTRRERIPVKKEDLEKLMPEVKGKTGYWAYFVVAADKVLKENGTLAIVIPEEFFVGRSAQSVREYLFSKGYQVHYVIRSSKEIAFSEGAHYRDYLIVMSRKPQIVPLTIVILKKSMKDITDIQGTCDRIKEFSSSLLEKLSTDEFDAIKVHNIRETTKKHIENLKPLIGFNTIKTAELTLELLDDLRDAPTLGDLERNQQIKIRDYNPGQYKTRGVESFARKLFISKYCPKGSKVVFLFDSKYSDKLCIKVKGSQLICLIPLGACAISLRTPSGVRHMDISDEEEAVIINPDALENEILKFAGLLPKDKVYEAARDIKYAYEDLSGNILIARRARLTSNNLFWLAFWSKNRIIGPSAPLINVQVKDIAFAKSLTLYFNSTISLLQLIAFSAETEGAWVALHGKQVWSHLHVPLPENVIEEKISKLFGELGKVDVKPLFSRIKKHDFIQRSLDELALEMLRLDAWKSRLDEIYDAVTKELETMHKILETSKTPRKSKIKLEQEEKRETDLSKWFG